MLTAAMIINEPMISLRSFPFFADLQDRLATDAWKIITALKKEKGDLEASINTSKLIPTFI